MAAHGLRFAGSLTVFLNMIDLAIPIPLHEEFRAIQSGVELEAKRDFIRNETFRRDLWVKGEPVTTVDEWLALNERVIYGTLTPAATIDRKVCFGEIELSYDRAPLSTMLETVMAQALSIADMGDVPALKAVPTRTRVDAARLLAAGGQVHGFANPTKPVKVSNSARLTMPPINRGIIKEMGARSAKVPLAATIAGTGVELSNIDAILLSALCDRGADDNGLSVTARGGAISYAARLMSGGRGKVIVGGKALPPREIENLLAERLQHVEGRLDKLVEIGVVGLAD
jgi:hypothetical protein